MEKKDGIHQIVHGSQSSSVKEFNYLIVTVYSDKIELELKKIKTVLKGKKDYRYDQYRTDPYRKRKVSITKRNKKEGFITVGKMSIEKQNNSKTFSYQEGYFKERLLDIPANSHKP